LSASGQSRRFGLVKAASGLPLIADNKAPVEFIAMGQKPLPFCCVKLHAKVEWLTTKGANA